MKTSSMRQVIVAMTIAVAAATVHGAWFSTTDATNEGAPAAVIRLAQWDHYQQKWMASIIVDGGTLRHSEGAILELRPVGAGEITFGLPGGLNYDELQASDLADLNIPEPSTGNLVSFGSTLPAPTADGTAVYIRLAVSELTGGLNTPPVNHVGPWSGPSDPTPEHLEAEDINGSVGNHLNASLSAGGESVNFTWDIGRWAKGDVFLGLNEATYKVIDREGNFKRFVATDDYVNGSLDNDYTLTTGCATNWQTGEVYATNFGEGGPAINVITRHPDNALNPAVRYSPASRRFSTRVELPGAPDDYYGIDQSPESIVFDANLNMYVGNSFGNFGLAPDGWGDDVNKEFEPDGEYTMDVNRLPLEGWNNDESWGWIVDENGDRLLLAPHGSGGPYEARRYGVDVSGRLRYDVNGGLILHQPTRIAGLPDWPTAGVPEAYMSDPATGMAMVTDNLAERAHRWSLGKRLHRYNNTDGLGEYSPTDRNAFWTFTGRQGTDWIDLNVTGDVMYYTSEDTFIHRYNVATGQQLPDVGAALPSRGKLLPTDARFHGLRILPPGDGTGGFLVATMLNVLLFNGNGKLVQQYAVHDDPYLRSLHPSGGRVSWWYTLEVDPGGRTFWASAHDTGWVYQFDIATGRELKRLEAVQFRNLGQNGEDDGGRRVEGICVMWEYTAPQEICFLPDGVTPEGVDNDGDGFIDENCQRLEFCSSLSPDDDDLDGFFDLHDTDCGEEAPPVARDDQYTTNQETPLVIDPTGVLQTGNTPVEDYDPDNRDDNPVNNDPLSVSTIGQSGTPAIVVPDGGSANTATQFGGSVTMSSDGGFIYNPATGFHGIDTFVYRVSDGLPRPPGDGTSPETDDVATVTILVRPLVVDDEFTMPDRQPYTVQSTAADALLADDSTNLTVVAVGSSSAEALANSLNGGYTLTGLTTQNGGQVTIAPNGTFTYTPATSFSGTDTFYYVGNDTFSNSHNVAEVRIIVPVATLSVTAEAVCVADVPYVTFSISSNLPSTQESVTIKWLDSLGVEKFSTVVTWANPTQPLETTIMWPGMVLDGTTPVDWPGWILSGGLWSEGNDGFQNTRPTSTVRFEVNPTVDVVVSYPAATENCAVAPPANLPPVAVDDTASTPEDTPVDITVLDDDSDPEEGPLTVSLPTATTTEGGTVTVNPNGTIHYVPASNFCGVDTFVYRITDAAGLTDTATVTVTVSCVADTPTIAATGGTFNYDGTTHAGTCTVTGVSGESLPGTLTYTPGGATVPRNVGTYTVNCHFAGNDDYSALDATATVRINPIPATVTAGSGSKTVGQVDPAFTTTHAGFLSADAALLAFSTTRASGETVGSYATSATATPTTTDNPLGNYDVTYFPGTFVINPAAPVCTIPAAPALALVRTQSTFDGTLRGSVQIMDAVGVTLNSSAVITGDLMVRGTPSITNNGTPTYTLVAGTGASTPTGHQFIFNSGAQLGRLVTRTDAIALPTVSAPPSPTGTRSVSMNQPTDDPGDFATLRNLTLNSNVGPVAVPAGTYGSFTANTNSSFVIGVSGATTPSVYNFQSLTLNSGSALTVVGPVVVTVGNSMSFNGPVGDLAHPEWFTLRTTSDVTLNSGVQFHGYVEAPNGRVTVNGAARLLGGLAANQLTINSGGIVELVQGEPIECSTHVVVRIDDKTKVYGDTDPALTYQITSGPIPPGVLTGQIARDTGEPVGEYEIGAGTLSVSGDFTLEVIPGTLTVTPRPATVTAGSGSKVFGTTPDPALTAIATSNFVAADLPEITLTQTREPGETVRTYVVTAEATGDILTNYTVTYFPGVFEITKAPSITTATGGTYTYDGSAKPQTCAVTGANGVTLTGATLTYSPGGSTPPTTVGTYTVTCEFGGDESHTDSRGTATVVIDPKEAVVIAGNGTKVYGTMPDPALSSVTTTGFVGGDAATLTLGQQRAPGETVRSYSTTATATGAVLSNYSVTYQAGEFTITPAPLTVQAHDKTRQVGEPNPTLDGVWTGLVNGDVITANYTTPATVASPAGTYVITPTPVDADGRLSNYTLTIIPGTLTVVAAPVCTATGYTTYSQGGWGSKPSGNNPGAFLAANFSTVYPDGQVQIGGTHTLTFTSASAIATFLPQGGSSRVLTSSATNPRRSSAGNFAAQLLAMQLALDFSRAGVTKPGMGGLVMQSGPLAGMTVDAIMAMANTVIGGTTSALPSGMSVPELSSILESLNMNFHEGTANEGLLGCGGTAPCSATQMAFTGDSPVNGTAGNIRTFSAGSVSVKVSAFSRVKGSGGSWAAAYLGVWSTGVGVTDTSESGSSDTHKTDNSGRLNYVLFEFSQPVIVSRAFLDSIGEDSDATVWVGTKVDPFNNHLTLSDAILSSLGVAQDSTGGGSARWAEFNDDAISGNVIVIAADVDGSNDAFKVSKLQLECGAVEPQPVAPTIEAIGGTFVYSGAAHAATCSVTGVDGLVLPGTLTYAPGSVAPTRVGAYTATCSFAGDATYAPASATATVTITPKPLTVEANDKSKVQGAANPVLDGTLTGVVSGDAITASYSTTATTSSPAGTYPIVPSLSDPGNKLSNYSVTITNGTLTVTPAAAVVNVTGGTFTYDGAAKAQSCTVKNQSGSVVGTGVITYSPGGSAAPVTVGTYGVTCAFSGNSSYGPASSTSTVTITPRAATVTAGGGTKVYGTSDPALSAVNASGFVTADLTGISLSQARAAGSVVGNYTTTAGATGAVLSNYAVTYVPGVFTITKATLTAVANNKTKTQGTANPTLDGTVTGVVSGDTITASYSTTATTSSAVGTYPITVTLADPGNKLGNYNVTKTDGTLTVTASTPACTARTFAFTGSSSTSGSAGNIRTFSVSGASVKASAHSRLKSGNTWANAYLGVWNQGLGVTDGSEGSGGNDTHKVDNGGDRYNYVLLRFSESMIITKAYLDSIGADSDATIWVGTVSDAYSGGVSMNDSRLASLQKFSSSGGSSERWATFNGGELSGNVVVIAANTTGSNDAFKVSRVQSFCGGS